MAGCECPPEGYVVPHEPDCLWQDDDRSPMPKPLDVAALRQAIHRVVCDRPEGYAKHDAGNGFRCQFDPRMDDELIASYAKVIR